jgi:hypothetical protein
LGPHSGRRTLFTDTRGSSYVVTGDNRARAREPPASIWSISRTTTMPSACTLKLVRPAKS